MEDDIKRVLQVGLGWLYSTEQPEDAAVSHLGIRSPNVNGRVYRCIPAGTNGAPVVVVVVADPRYIGAPGEQELTNPLGADELTILALQIEQLGFPFASTWNGRFEQGSVGLMGLARPSLLAAAKRRCPDHQNPLCGWDGCPWRRESSAKSVCPTGWF